MKNDLTLVSEENNGSCQVKAYLRQDGRIELWEKDNSRDYGYWELNRCLSMNQVNAYATLLATIMEKVK